MSKNMRLIEFSFTQWLPIITALNGNDSSIGSYNDRSKSLGGVVQMAGDFLVYTTQLNHTPKAHGSVIVRTDGAVIPIECCHYRRGNVSSNPIKPTWIPFSSTKSGEGLLSFSLRLMMTGLQNAPRLSTTWVTSFTEASVSMTNHMPLKLYIDRCVATLSPDKDSTPRYSIIDYNGCLLDSKAEDSFSTFVLPRDKLHFDLDAFRFFGDDHSLIFLACHLKVAAVERRDSMSKACTFQKLQNVWAPLEGSNNDVCACCHLGDCGATRELVFPSRGRRDLVPEAGVESEVVLMVALTMTTVSLISAVLMALFLYRKHKQTHFNSLSNDQ
uniref:zona pellucida sperm-binding protein 3-like n=1 Tax=Pristiophorus japonicus TaxID=55135 RepID=UPI00398F2CB6